MNTKICSTEEVKKILDGTQTAFVLPIKELAEISEKETRAVKPESINKWIWYVKFERKVEE